MVFTSLTITCSYIVYAADNEARYVFPPGTAYYSAHSIDQNAQIFNYAPEAHGFYWFNQKQGSLPVQLYYSVYPHIEGNSCMTHSCNIEMEVIHKSLGFLWEKVTVKSTTVDYNELCNNEFVTGCLDGPNYTAITVITTYTFYDFTEGACTWSIAGQ